MKIPTLDDLIDKFDDMKVVALLFCYPVAILVVVTIFSLLWKAAFHV